jgi:hypothetical protein
MAGGEGARICIDAIGAQEPYLLSKKPEDGEFFYESKRHSEFSKYHRSTLVKNPEGKPSWPFGETLKVEFRPQDRGDLLSNMWVSITLPGLTGGKNYTDQIGRHIIKSVTMRIDETILEEYHADWGIINDELYLEMSEKVANRFLVNRSLAFDSTELNENDVVSAFESEILIPINMFFSRKYATDEYSGNNPNRPFFPLCACHKQKIIFEFQFFPQQYFCDADTQVLSLPEFNIITEEITVTREERLYLQKIPQTFVTEIVTKHPVTDTVPGDSTLTQQLVPNIPVKAIHWFFRDKRFEQETLIKDPSETDEGKFWCHNRYNFSRADDFDELNTFFVPVMKDAKLYVKGNRFPNTTTTDHNFFKYLVPFQKKLARPVRNIYTMSFSMNPLVVEPSGSLDFSSLTGNKTTLECTLEAGLTETYSLHMYYTGYTVFKIEEGKLAIHTQPMSQVKQDPEAPLTEQEALTVLALQEPSIGVAKKKVTFADKIRRKIPPHLLKRVRRLFSM